LQNAPAEKKLRGGLRGAMRGCTKSQLKVRLRRKARHASNTASAAPQNQANCIAKKFARWAAMCYAGFALKALSSNCFATSLSPRNSASAAPQNQANCIAKKFARWVAVCYAGLDLKVCSKLGSGAKPATPKNVRHSAPCLPATNTATAAPQNQLQLAECTRQKIRLKFCVLHCRVTQRNIYFW